MIPEDYTQVIELLFEKSSKNELNWRPTSNEEKFLVNFEKFSISITTGGGEGDLPYILFNVLNESGKTIDNFYVGHGEEWYDNCEEMYGRARRKALKINEAISQLKKELQGGGVVGEDESASEKKLGDDLPF